MSLRSYKARKMVLGSDFSSNTQEERIPFSAHVKNDQLQSQFFGLESKLKLLEYLEKENQNSPDQSIQLQLEEARQSLRSDLIALNKQGVSLSQIMSRMGEKLMASKVVYANYILKRFSRPHTDFLQLFRSQQAYLDELNGIKAKQEQKQIQSAESPDDLMFKLREITENKLADSLPIAEKYGEVLPQQSVHKHINGEAIEKAEKIVEDVEVQPQPKEITEKTQFAESEIKPVIEQPETIETMKKELEIKLQPEVLSKIETEDDVYKYAKQQNYFDKRGNLKNKGYVSLLKEKIFSNLDLSYEQKKQLTERAEALYHQKRKPKTETAQFIQ